MPFNFQRLEHVRIGLALVAAVVTGGAALYGVYVNAREATAASYETLAPEINALKQAVFRLDQDNQELRRALGQRAPAAEPAQPGAARSAPRRPRAQPEPAPPRDAPPTATLPPEAPPPGSPAPEPPPAPSPQPGPAGGLPEEIQKRVPIDFEKAREIWKDVKNLPRRP